jgi:hypothetical protein
VLLIVKLDGKQPPSNQPMRPSPTPNNEYDNQPMRPSPTSLCLDLLHLLEHITTFTSISSRFMLLIACISIMVYVISLFHCRIRYLVWVMGALAGSIKKSKDDITILLTDIKNGSK